MMVEEYHLRAALSIPEKTRLGPLSLGKRMASIDEAIAWEGGGDQEHMLFYNIYEEDSYRVCLGKPGKEASKDYNRAKWKDGSYGNNPNDMLPCVFIDGERVERNLSFSDIFEVIQEIGRQDDFALELLGTLLFREAYMLDHEEIDAGVWRYKPPKVVVDEIVSRLPDTEHMPTNVFIHMIEALALNEDVKYHTLGYEIKQGIGRRNNLLTCAHIIAVFLNKASLVKFAGSMARPPSGVAPITQKGARAAFGFLNEE